MTEMSLPRSAHIPESPGCGRLYADPAEIASPHRARTGPQNYLYRFAPNTGSLPDYPYSLCTDGTILTGTMSGVMRGGTLAGEEETVNVQAEYERHAGSLCSMQIISQIIQNGAAGGALDSGGQN